jgi:S1-C subfamily serine protease
MKNKFLIFLLFVGFLCNAQLNGYKYAYIDFGEDPDKYNVIDYWNKSLKGVGLVPILRGDLNDLIETGKECMALTIYPSWYKKGRWQWVVKLQFNNCNNVVVHVDETAVGNDMSSTSRDIRVAGQRIINKFKEKYQYIPNLTPKRPDNFYDVTQISSKLDINSQASIRTYFDNKSLYPFEGMWRGQGRLSGYKLAIFYNDYKYHAIIIDNYRGWKIGECKAILEETAVDEISSIDWIMGDKVSENKSTAIIEKEAILKFDINDEEVVFLKTYPKLSKQTSNSKKIRSSAEWSGNGSGIIISRTGYIVTNHHVIEDASEIEVEFIIDDEIKKFSAQTVQSDKVNDLAIIKIFDMNFDGLDELPYNFKTRISEVGTKVYAYGYPMALSLMGKEIKITDGIISSKSGIDGDITTYQISASIQPGNSGGPLFDNKANFIGINSSGLARYGSETTGYTIKSNYVLNLIDVLPKNISLPSNTKLETLPLTEQIKEISKYVVLIKVK